MKDIYEKCEISIDSNLMNEQHRSMMMTLDCFLRVYNTLNNFVEFLELRGFKGCPVYYKKIPLQGALEISSKLTTPNAPEWTLPERMIERPGLFVDYFSNACCSKGMELSEDIANKIETVVKCLAKPSTVKNCTTRLTSILFALAGLPCTHAAPEKLQILSVLLREATENVICCDHKILKCTLKQEGKPLAHIQTETLLNLVSNFIREWGGGGTPCEAQPRSRICKFCDSIINHEARQYAIKFCCDEAEQFDRMSKEWLALLASQDASKFKIGISNEYRTAYSGESASRRADVVRARVYDADNNAKAECIFAGEDDVSTLEGHYRNRIASRATADPRKSTSGTRDERQRDVAGAAGEVGSRKIGRTAGSGIETGRPDVIADEAPSEARGNRSPRPRRGEALEASAGGARSGVDARNADTTAKRIREGRDNNPYRREPVGVADKERRDRRSAQRDVGEETDGSWLAAGKRGAARGAERYATAEENERDRGGNPHQRRRAEERETRSPDNNAEKIGRLARVEEEESTDAQMTSRKPAKRPEVVRVGDGRRVDRHEDEEKSVSRRDKKRTKEGKDEEEEAAASSGKSIGAPVEGKRTVDSRDDGRKGRFADNEGGRLPADDRKHKDASTGGRYEADVTKKANSSNPIEYQLSNVHFVELGWTVLPVIKTMRKIVQYEARLAKPDLDWFEKYRNKGTQYYDDDDGRTPFLSSHPDGSGELFYPNGALAVRVHRPENRKYDMYTAYTPGGKDALGIERESQILAIFDTMGNGVVLDEDGAARLSYNQNGGIFTDSPAGLPLVWTWSANPRRPIVATVYAERSADRLQREFFSKSSRSSGNVKTPISPSSSRNKEKKVVEVQKPVVGRRQEEVGNKSSLDQDLPTEDTLHIKAICMKLNEFLGLRILDRRNIALRFSAKNKSIRIELGTVLNFNKEVASYMIEGSRDWKRDMLRCRFQEKLSSKLNSDSSLYDLAKEYRRVKRFAKERKAMITKYRPVSHYQSYVEG